MTQFIDATIIKGKKRIFTASIQQLDETETVFEPMNLDEFAIHFKVLGSATADAKVLVEHIITQVSDIEVDGLITNPANGEFSFTITEEDTHTLGLGNHPIMIDFHDINTDKYIFTLTEGGLNGEFNKINVVEV